MRGVYMQLSTSHFSDVEGLHYYSNAHEHISVTHCLEWDILIENFFLLLHNIVQWPSHPKSLTKCPPHLHILVIVSTVVLLQTLKILFILYFYCACPFHFFLCYVCTKFFKQVLIIFKTSIFDYLIAF